MPAAVALTSLGESEGNRARRKEREQMQRGPKSLHAKPVSPLTVASE